MKISRVGLISSGAGLAALKSLARAQSPASGLIGLARALLLR